MPILDHFHPPLSLERHWDSFHTAWAGSLADALNRQLPAGFFAEEHTHGGGEVEIDVAAFERAAHQGNGSGGNATGASWSPPAPAFTLPLTFAENFEVRIFGTRTGPRLVAAVELVSPRNKDRRDARLAFVHKCASYLHEGVGLIIADIVTGRQANLHNDLMRLLGMSADSHLPAEVALYAAAYRPVRRQERDEFDLWPVSLEIGGDLPILPLGITGELVLPVDLDAAYRDVCQRRRLVP